MGMEEEAVQVNLVGKEEGSGTSRGCDILKELAMKLLPRRMQARRLPSGYSWEEIHQEALVLGVLRGSDGSNSHAVTIHRKFIFDSNEEIAIPLKKSALDYCTSDVGHDCTFVDFYKGWIFDYNRKKRLYPKELTAWHLVGQPDPNKGKRRKKNW